MNRYLIQDDPIVVNIICSFSGRKYVRALSKSFRQISEQYCSSRDKADLIISNILMYDDYTARIDDLPDSLVAHVIKNIFVKEPDFARRLVDGHSKKYDIFEQVYKSIPDRLKFAFLTMVSNSFTLDSFAARHFVRRLSYDITYFTYFCDKFDNDIKLYVSLISYRCQ